jgi:excisionase family DNA binding protein
MTTRALTIREVCERYGVGQATVRSWLRTGELRGVNCGRRPGSKKPRWRVTAEALAAFELLRTPNPPPPRTKRRKRQADVIAFY